MDNLSKVQKCRNAIPDINNTKKIQYFCRRTESMVDGTQCEACTSFKSRYIEYPIEIKNIDIKGYNYEKDNVHRANQLGKLVSIRPCDEKKTYLGIFLGELPMNPNVSYNYKTKELSISSICNPAIFVPTLNKIVFGYESWWHVIDNETEFKEISDQDINSQWYVKLAQNMFQKNNEY